MFELFNLKIEINFAKIAICDFQENYLINSVSLLNQQRGKSIGKR